MAVSTLIDAEAERRRAARALLARPLLTAGTEEFRLVRKHAAYLAGWFTQETGWRLVVDTQAARLFKTPARLTDGTRPALVPRGRVPFTRRRYVLLCLALVVLERSDAQITLGRLAEGVLTGAADPALTQAGIEFRLERREERSDLVAAVRLLLDLGALRRVAGDEESFLSAAGGMAAVGSAAEAGAVVRADSDVLYDVERRVLAELLAGTQGPSTVRERDFELRLAALTAEPAPDTDELRLRALRQRLTRRLLDDPVVYYAQLSEEERAYLVSQRHAVARRINELTGLVAELRAEGVAMADPDDELTDVRMPEQGTDGHVTLLLAAHLAGARHPQPVSDLVDLVRRLAGEHRTYWRKTATEPAAAADLVAQALARLEALDLVETVYVVEQGGGGREAVLPKPAIARYALAAPTIRKAEPR
ncbi:MAG TPA: TIGR02678 family protein [Actinocrinis sp.]|jgi:uncharacterized protein (TIGR02678 family)